MASSAKIFDSIMARFPQRFSLAFAYGSSVFSQGNKSHQKNMIDFIFCVDDPLPWHQANLQANNKHYSMLKYAGPDFIKYVQEHFGAKMYFNSLVEVENRLIKYGIISTTHLIEDLLDWQTLYISGRLHKPVKILKKVENTDVQQALLTNLQSALHASLLCLPENFTEEELYLKIADLSYAGDFRMYFGEDKRKVENIVKNQVPHFRSLYADQLKLMPQLHWNQTSSTIEHSYSAVVFKLCFTEPWGSQGYPSHNKQSKRRL
ncbi:phosphatidate cytidylyltransferase, mitochondrial [Trichonephila clavata]|uniref:Phosphatidate cytidylyltransferase, mitochondrial n=1 Tax=Trichonephila clavata TaxID=2740835 RepID=A0A8X6GPV1_TRICU|nr:phosphatidate cytidylyltransferase, mitochondrial [Trichonephila clavata]